MTTKTRSDLLSQFAADLADNTSGDISAEDIRNALTDLVDSVLSTAGEGSIASGNTTNIGAEDEDILLVTGTTGITSFGTSANKFKLLRFADALTITHNATSLILPGGQDITTAADDLMIAQSDGSGNWRVLSFVKGGIPALTGSTNTFTKAQRGSLTTLTDGANISIDMADNNFFEVTLGGNRTLDNPSNAVAGQTGFIRVAQDGTGSRTLSFGSNYKFAGGTAPTLTTDANAIDYLCYAVYSSTEILITPIQDIS